MALTTHRIAADSDPKLKKLKFSIRIIPGDEFRRISSDRSIDEVSGSDFARASCSRWGAHSGAWGRLGGGAGAGHEQPSANSRAPTTPKNPNFYHLLGHLGQMQFRTLLLYSFLTNPHDLGVFRPHI